MGIGPSIEYICNKVGQICQYLDAWYNGGMEVHGRCKKGAWKGIKSWGPRQGCETPKTCPLLPLKGE